MYHSSDECDEFAEGSEAKGGAGDDDGEGLSILFDVVY